jgi:hypothetical protein
LTGLAQLAPLSVVPAPADNDAVTAQTVSLMWQYVQAATQHPPVIEATRQALDGLREDSPAWQKARAIHSWIAKHTDFVAHEKMLPGLGFQGDEQLLIPPYLFLETGQGDCPMYAMLTAAMLEIAGVPAIIVTLAADQRDPTRWSHVYTVAVEENGDYLPVDTAAAAQRPGLGMGWEATGYRRADWMA